MAETELSFEQLPPEAQQAFSSPSSNVDVAGAEIDPVDTLDELGLFELSKNKMFSPLEYAQQHPEKATNPDVVRVLSDVHSRIRERGFTFSDLPSVGEAAKGVGHMIAGAAKQGWNYLNAFVGVPLAGVAGAITGQPPTFSEELTQEAQRRMIETAAGTEAAITGLSQLPGRAVGKAVHRLGTASGLGKPYDQQTEQEKSKAFFDDLGKAQAAGEIAQGRGGLVGTISGETQKELAEAGKPIRPEEVGTLAAGDPLSFILFGKAFGAAGGAASRALPKTGAGAALVEKAGEVATTVGGRAIQTAGKITEFGGATTKFTGKVLPIVGALKGAALAGPSVGLTGGLAAGAVAGRAAGRIGQTLSGAGERLAGFGEQVATGVGLTPYSQAARDILASSPIVASETLKGGAFDLALAAATSESPQETEAAAAFGTVLGGLKGVGRGSLKVAQGQIITPRPWGSPKVTPAYGSFAALDSLHSQASVSAAPGQALRANAIREFLSGAGNKVQAYLMPDATAMEKAVTDILVRQGEAPAVAQATAKSAAQAKGMFTRELIDDKGNSRRVVLLNEADAAPHEAFHGIQDVLGESANQVVDGLVFQEYAPQWESIGQQYAQRLGGTGSWREIILDRTGWGNAASAEKALRDAANKIEGETGAVARPQDVRAMAEGVLTDARRNGAGWRDILTPEEATAEANRYLARELAAENFDAAFKALGSGLVEGNTLPEALARVIARTAQFMGVEPLAGARTEGLRIEPRLAVTETVTGLGRSLIEPAQGAPNPAVATKPAAAPKAEVSRWARKSTTPEVAATEADKVMTWLQTASIPVANRAAAAQTLAQAMQNQQGVRLTYFGAKGEPGGDPAALRPERRAEIEAQRDAPNADRPIVTKDYFPYGAIITSKGPQFKGWSPNNFNANVTRFADWLAANPEAAKNLSNSAIWRYGHELSTEAGRRAVQADLQTFIQNQMAGFTGSGLEMVVPEGTGATAPVRTGVQPVALPQERADFISYLFNLKLPETPRITAGKLPLNIVGQRVSEATLPGRVVEPVRERGAFAGPQAEALGIAGEQIREVNPFRQTVEQAAKDAGVKPPELIEAAQILALDRMAYAEGAPELPQFGGNVVTLTAGFLPGEIAQRGREISAMTPDEFQARAREWNGGLTGEAKRVGLGATSIEEVNTLRQFEAEAKAKGASAMKARDFDTAMSQASISQFFREAREAATGEGGVGEALRRDLGEGYVPPVPERAAAPVAETGAQFLPTKDKAFVEELEKIRKGESGGQTFNADGSVWVPPAEPYDLVTLASTTIPRERLTGAEFEKATAPYQDLLAQPNVAAGVFSFEQAGKPVTSIDINAVVPQTFRDNTLAFARANDQAALWDVTKGELVETGGSGVTRITTPEQMRAATESLIAGEPVDVAALTARTRETTSQPAAVEDYRRPTLDWKAIAETMFEDSSTPEFRSQSIKKDYLAAAEVMNSGITPESWRDLSYSLQKRIRNIADYRKEHGGSYYEAEGRDIELRGTAKFPPESTGQFLPAEQAGLPGVTSGREYDRKAIEGMSQAQLKEYFPEAIIPKKNTEHIQSQIADSPLSKSAGSREAAVQAFSDKLVKFYREREDNPALQAGAKWYSEFTPLLKKEFGKDSRIFAELLAATSPNNKPDVNFAFALDALQNWKAGKYNKMIAKFNEGLNKLPDGGLQRVYERDLKAGKVTDPPEKPSDATYLAHWIEKHNLIPRSSSGARFSMHSVPVLKVLARKWLELNTGLKTDNFIKNLVGEGDEATIDVWADRTMRRLGYEGFRPRWRIMPRNKTGVTDEDFVFSQQAFRMAAEEIGIKPSALQGALWFAEKQLWSENGWGKLDLGDYRTELEKMPQLRAGFASREARARAESAAGESEQLEILPR